MITARLGFGRPPARGDAKAREALDELSAALFRNGQIHEAGVLAFDPSRADLYVTMPRPTALDARHLSRWGRRAWEQASTMFGRSPRVVLLERPSRVRWRRWQDAAWLFIGTSFLEQESPVRTPGTGETSIPLYELPIPEEERGYLVDWISEFRACDTLWISSRSLEIEAYREMVDPNSELSRAGRGFAAQIESFTGKPVYYYLQRFYGRSEKEEIRRRCPGCGGPWRLRARLTEEREVLPHPPFAPRAAAAFRCEDCRLISNHADDPGASRYFEIGEWKSKERARQNRRH